MLGPTVGRMAFNVLTSSRVTRINFQGPFKCTPVRVGPCANPPLPLDPNPAALFNAEIVNLTKNIKVIRFNVTVLRESFSKQLKVKGYHWENGKWKIHSLVNNLACNIIFKTTVSVVTGMKFDKKTCKFFKGAYVFDFDIDRIEHMWIKTQEYGRIMWRLESFSSAGLINCWEYETLVEPI
uniref:Uncharacterized protein n=1 Tax=Bombyx mori TaxID=7091 RepID=A0A8R2HR88_BOMMO|nr:uncharacterized protein LOC110385681 [Bombyx mori]